MKRSLPVIAGLGVIVVVALLIGGGFLSLPTSGDDAAANDGPVHDPAPQLDPEPLDVAFQDEDGNDQDGKKDDRKAGKKKKERSKKDRKSDSQRKKAARGDDRKGSRSRQAPSVTDRNPGKKGNAAKPPPKDGGSQNEPPNDVAAVTVTDLRGDPEGEGSAPGYMDLEAVQLRAAGDTFVAQLTFAGRLPPKMPNDDHAMLASIEVERSNGKKLSVYAEASDDGWRAHTNRSTDFPGTVAIDGRTMRFTLARSFFGDRFAWYAHSSWTRSTTTTTDYFFDFAPDDGNGRFPSGGTT